MKGPYFIRNGEIERTETAFVSLDDVNFTYGYGVYETLKVRKGLVYFSEQHALRLLQSASIIGLKHGYSKEDIIQSLKKLATANELKDANIKILLIGRSPERSWGSETPDADNNRSTETEQADLYVLALNPLFPKRTDYRHGVKALLFCGERSYPMAKSLNMLTSTMAFREARSRDGYDAILLDRRGILREGTRTNLFFTDGKTIFTPPGWTVLEGVTRHTIIECCNQKGYVFREQELNLADLLFEDRKFNGLFLSSTSSKIMPVKSLEPSDHNGPGSYSRAFGLDGAGAVPWTAFVNAECIDFDIPEIIHDLMNDYDSWLEGWEKAHAEQLQ